MGLIVPEVYFWDGWQTVEETDTSGTLQQQYVYGEGLDEVVRANLPDAADIDADLNTSEKVDLFFHHNSLGSVVAVTDAAGTVKESYRYSAFGQPTIFNAAGSEIASSAVKQPFMFSGARWDEESSLYQMRHRYYDPVAGRFISRDPLGMWGDAAQRGNGQAYCGHDPVNFVDPMGLELLSRGPSAGDTLSNAAAAIRMATKNGPAKEAGEAAADALDVAAVRAHRDAAREAMRGWGESGLTDAQTMHFKMRNGGLKFAAGSAVGVTTSVFGGVVSEGLLAAGCPVLVAEGLSGAGSGLLGYIAVAGNEGNVKDAATSAGVGAALGVGFALVFRGAGLLVGRLFRGVDDVVPDEAGVAAAVTGGRVKGGIDPSLMRLAELSRRPIAQIGQSPSMECSIVSRELKQLAEAEGFTGGYILQMTPKRFPPNILIPTRRGPIAFPYHHVYVHPKLGVMDPFWRQNPGRLEDYIAEVAGLSGPTINYTVGH